MIEELQLHRREVLKKYYKNPLYKTKETKSFRFFFYGAIFFALFYVSTTYILYLKITWLLILSLSLLIISSVIIYISNSFLDKHILISNILKNQFTKDQHIDYLENLYGDINSEHLSKLSSIIFEKAQKKRKSIVISFSSLSIIIPFIVTFINLQNSFKLEWLMVSVILLIIIFLTVRVLTKKVESVLNKEANELEELAEILREAAIFIDRRRIVPIEIHRLKEQAFPEYLPVMSKKINHLKMKITIVDKNNPQE
ncbi:hypothetical protein [Exiguobacterium sp. SH0S2]|uniref:hypothetical protein n=2 Tax=unclassified Exiguobacterium TaxID=2644629 RepID=UPI00103900D7|nr:hypothetical protein [Exiguobacterium sp. SH0S2]TCI59061.1 hypothetical protein EVJ21_14080 [Exiguobacterium sp. SH0S2]